MGASSGADRRLFDLWSFIYDQPLVQRLTYRPVQDAVVEALTVLRPKRILDVGCGTGLLTTRLRDTFAGTTVVGCDFSSGMLAQASARTREIAWVRGDAQRLPFGDGTFDAVVSTEAFHWFPDQPAAVAEVARVLGPGGRALVALVNTPSEAVRALVRAGSRAVGQPFDWPTMDHMRRLFEAAGFHIESQRRIYRLPAGLLLPPVLTIGYRPVRGRPGD